MSHRGYFCKDQHTCVLTITSSTLHMATCVSGVSGGVIGSSYLTVPYTTITDNYTERVSTYSVLAPMIQLLYQSSDISTIALSSASSQATSSSIQAQGLSTGAKAGIGVGVALAVIIAATIGVSLWWAKSRRGRKSVPDNQRASAEVFLGELAEGEAKQGPVELQGFNKPAELDLEAKQGPVELQGHNKLAELHAPAGLRASGGAPAQEPAELE